MLQKTCFFILIFCFTFTYTMQNNTSTELVDDFNKTPRAQELNGVVVFLQYRECEYRRCQQFALFQKMKEDERIEKEKAEKERLLQLKLDSARESEEYLQKAKDRKTAPREGETPGYSESTSNNQSQK